MIFNEGQELVTPIKRARVENQEESKESSFIMHTPAKLDVGSHRPPPKFNETP